MYAFGNVSILISCFTDQRPLLCAFNSLDTCMIRRTLVSSKTKQSKKVFTLQLNKEALINNRSTSGKNWKVNIYHTFIYRFSFLLSMSLNSGFGTFF